MRKIRFLHCSLFLLFITSLAYAADFKINPTGRVRYESLSDYDFDSDTSDHKSFVGSRFWALMEMSHKDYKIVFQPQFSRVWGLNDAAGPASGGVINPSMNVHQAYFLTPVSDKFKIKLKLGRQELSYGDELVLGSVIWSNVGRSFDAVKLEWNVGKSQLDFFSSKLSDQNVTTPGQGDKDLHGVYFSGRNDFKLFKEIDVYALNINDSTVTPHADSVSYGLRLKGSYDFIDYRAEITKQHMKSNESSQFDVEAGLDLGSFGRVGFNYFVATESYNQLFPTAHKWLGIGDVISRKNLKGFQLKHQLQINDKFKTEFTYHYFDRYNMNVTAFSFSGVALGTATNPEFKIGDEYDVIINYSYNENLSYQIGATYFVPGNYLKQSGKNDAYKFIYLQALLKM